MAREERCDVRVRGAIRKHAPDETIAERRRVLRILQHERTLKITVAVQSRGQAEVPFEQCARLPEQIENRFGVHYVAFPLCVVRRLSSNNFRIRLYSSAQLEASMNP